MIKARSTVTNKKQGEKTMSYSIFMIDDTAWVFSPQKFCSLMDKVKREKSKQNGRHNVSDAQIYKELSERIFISPDAIKKWKQGKNSFSEEKYLEGLSQYFGVDKIDLLVPFPAGGRKLEPPDHREDDRAEVNRVFTEAMNALFQIVHFESEERGLSRRQLIVENEQNAVKRVRSLRQSVYAHSLLVSPHIKNKLCRLLVDIEKIIDSGLEDNPWEDMPDHINEYEAAIYCFHHFEAEIKEDIYRDSSIDGVSYLYDEIELAEDLGLGNVVEPDDRFESQLYNDAETLMQYGYQGNYEITPKMVFDHILTKYISAVFRYHFPELFEDF